jgi:phospholipase D1/2
MVIPHYLGSSETPVEIQDNVNDRVFKREDSFSSCCQDQDIPLLLPQEPSGLDIPPGLPKPNGRNSSQHHHDKPRRISSGLPFSFRRAKVAAVGPDTPMKGFVDDLDSEHYHEKMPHERTSHVDSQNTDLEWWDTQERGDQGGFADESGQIGPRASCRCQVFCFHRAEVSLTYLNIIVSMTYTYMINSSRGSLMCTNTIFVIKKCLLRKIRYFI